MSKRYLVIKIVFLSFFVSLLLSPGLLKAKSPKNHSFKNQPAKAKHPRIKSVNKLQEIDISIIDPQGQTWAGNHIWVADDATNKLYMINPSSGKVMRAIPSPGSHPRGLTWDGKNLWCSDSKTEKIYKVDPKDGAVLSSINAPVSPSINALPDSVRGLAWDGEYLWSAYYDGWGSRINRVHPDTGEVDKYFFPSGIPQGLDYDGQYLYCVNNNNYIKKDNFDKNNYIWQYNPSELRLIDVIKIPSVHPRGLAIKNGEFWHMGKGTMKLLRMKIKAE